MNRMSTLFWPAILAASGCVVDVMTEESAGGLDEPPLATSLPLPADYFAPPLFGPGVDALPKDGDGLPGLDAMNTVHRFAALAELMRRSVIRSTRCPEFSMFEGDDNLFWGLLLQHQWQLESGRLQLDGMLISQDSWWGAMNYYLGVVPYIGAVRSQENGVSFAPPLILVLPARDGSSDARYQASEAVIDVWKRVFDELRAVRREIEAGRCPACAADREALYDRVYEKMWAAHTASVAEATRQFAALWARKYQHTFQSFDRGRQTVTSAEGRFAAGWAQFVYFIGETYFRCDRPTIRALQASLPPRVLRSTRGLTPSQENMVLSMNAVHALGDPGRRVLLRLFQNANTTPQRRAYNRAAMKTTASDPFDSIWALLQRVLNANSRGPSIFQHGPPPERWARCSIVGEDPLVVACNPLEWCEPQTPYLPWVNGYRFTCTSGAAEDRVCGDEDADEGGGRRLEQPAAQCELEVASLVLDTCGGSCRNRVCDPGETCANCPADCGQCLETDCDCPPGSRLAGGTCADGTNSCPDLCGDGLCSSWTEDGVCSLDCD